MHDQHPRVDPLRAQVAAMGKADADVCNDLGVSHFESGDDEKAAHFFSEAIAKNDRHAPAISNRANCLKRQGKLREAEADYTRAIELDGHNPKAFMNRGLLLREQVRHTLERGPLRWHLGGLASDGHAICSPMRAFGGSSAPGTPFRVARVVVLRHAGIAPPLATCTRPCALTAGRASQPGRTATSSVLSRWILQT